MVLGMIVLPGCAILVHITLPFDRMHKKLIHMGLLLSGYALAVTGLVAIFRFHDAIGDQHLDTVHEWLGLLTVILAGLQGLLGTTFFVFPRASERVRAAFSPYHRLFGCLIFAMSVCTAVSGIQARQIFYDTQLPQIGNGLGYTIVFLLLAAMSALFLHYVVEPVRVASRAGAGPRAHRPVIADAAMRAAARVRIVERRRVSDPLCAPRARRGGRGEQ